MSSSDSDVQASVGVVQDVQQPKYILKCRSKKLVNMISKFNETQKAAVTSIGFGGLLHLKFKYYPTDYVHHFVKAFNDGSYVFRLSEAKEFLVTKYDVHDCFLLPMGPHPVPKLPIGRMTDAKLEAVKEVKRRWRQMFDVTYKNGLIPIDRVEKAILADTEGGDLFKKLFFLFSMSYFLCPTSNASLDLRLLTAADDINRLTEFDWCTFVLDGLAGAGSDTRSQLTCLLGCWPFLMITYFHRFDFRGQPEPSDLPLVKHWDSARMMNRLKGELVGGNLGRQLKTSVSYPRCQDPTYRIQESIPQTEPSSHGVNDNDANVKLQKVKCIEIDLPPGLDDDAELHRKAADGVHELYLQMQRNAIAFHSWYMNATAKILKLTTPRPSDPVVVPSQSTQAFFEDPKLHKYVDEVVEVAKLLKSTTDRAPSLEDHCSSQVKEVLDDIRCANLGDEDDESALNYPNDEPRVPVEDEDRSKVDNKKSDEICGEDIDMLTDLYTTAEIQQAMRDCDLLRTGNEVGSGVVEGSNGEAVTSNVGVVNASEGAPSVPTHVSDANVSEGGPPVPAHQILRTPVAKLPFRRPSDVMVSEQQSKRTRLSVAATSVPIPINKSSPVKLTPLKCGPRGEGDGIGCSLYCGESGSRPEVLSLFMRNNQTLFEGIPTLRKEVADYCFLDDWDMDPSEIVVDYGDGDTLTRRDICSLLPDRDLTTNVIDCWAKLLNYIEGQENDVPRMAFLNLRHMEVLNRMAENNMQSTQLGNLKDQIYSIWDDFVLNSEDDFYMDANLFFIPLFIREHFACVCINFNDKTIDILDNQSMPTDGRESELHKFSEFVAVECLSDFLEKWNNGKAGGITNYEVRWIKFKWQQKSTNNIDSGVFTMMHMAIYEGTPILDDDLKSRRYQRCVTCQLAATLLLADINQQRDNLLQKVNIFNESKSSMLKPILEKRELKRRMANKYPSLIN